MDSKDCIVISDDEEENDVSVQVLGEFKTTNESIIDLTDSQCTSPSPPVISTSPNDQDPEHHDNTLIKGSPPVSDLQTRDVYSPYIPDSPRAAESPVIPDSPVTPDSPPNRSSQPVTSTPRRKETVLFSSSQPSPSVNTKKVQREELKQQKLREKEAKKISKESERVEKAANRANAASKATQNCTAIVDRNILKLIHDETEAHFTTLFEESSLNYKITDYPKLEYGTFWTFKRTEVENGNCVVKTIDSDVLLLMMDGCEYARRILLFRDDPENRDSLNNFISEIRKQFQSCIVIIVYNLNEYIKIERSKEAKRHQKKFKDRFEGRSEGGNGENGENEAASKVCALGLTELQQLRLDLLVKLKLGNVDLKVTLEFREKTQEVVDSIVKLTKSVAGREIKKKERTSTDLDWAINMDKGKAIDPLESPEECWIKQLQQFPQITLPIAKTIAAEYPTPGALLDQYQNLTISEAQDLLSELHVQRNLKRQVGQNISRRIYRFLTSEDPNLHICFD